MKRSMLIVFTTLLLQTPVAVKAQHEGENCTCICRSNFADFNGDGFSDLAIGVPGDAIGDISNAGAVNVIYGAPSGLSAAGSQLWAQDQLSETPEENDHFGTALAVGDFNGDCFVDLAIGAPREDTEAAAVPGAVTDAGKVHVLYGSARGLSSDSAGLDHTGRVLARWHS